MDTITANKIYDILIEECGATERIREMFVYTMTANNPPIEFRFGGNLGTGGKFYVFSGRWYVSCYPEDRTDEREIAIRFANQKIMTLQINRNLSR